MYFFFSFFKSVTKEEKTLTLAASKLYKTLHGIFYSIKGYYGQYYGFDSN